MIDRQIIFYIAFESDKADTDTGIIRFEWDQQQNVMTAAYQALNRYMNEKYPSEEYSVKDWEWVDKR